MYSSTCFPESARHFVLWFLPGPNQSPFKLTQNCCQWSQGTWTKTYGAVESPYQISAKGSQFDFRGEKPWVKNLHSLYKRLADSVLLLLLVLLECYLNRYVCRSFLLHPRVLHLQQSIGRGTEEELLPWIQAHCFPPSHRWFAPCWHLFLMLVAFYLLFSVTHLTSLYLMILCLCNEVRPQSYRHG